MIDVHLKHHLNSASFDEVGRNKMMKQDSPHTHAILREYDTRVLLFRDFQRNCERLIAELLRLEAIEVHSVTSRVKERSTLAEKLGREGKQYARLEEITDVVGIRVITHYEDEVDVVGRIIEREFSVDLENSTDKRKVLDPDRFGYLSLHYVCGLSKSRLELAENRRFAGLKCEVQIRSILQHTWAEIEHDLGYKSAQVVPGPIRRRFSMLAGLLELADQQFAQIRDELASYQQRVSGEIASAPSAVGIDPISLAAFINNSEIVRRLDHELAGFAHKNPTDVSKRDIEGYVRYLKYVNIETIEDLNGALETWFNSILHQGRNRLSPDVTGSISKGISIFYLFSVLLAEKGVDAVVAGFLNFNIDADIAYAERIVELFHQDQAKGR